MADQQTPQDSRCYVLPTGECISPLDCVHGDGLPFSEFVEKATGTVLRRSVYREPAMIVLAALLSGQRVTLGDYGHVVALDGDRDLRCVIEHYAAGSTAPTEMLGDFSVTVSWFIKACAALPPAELARLAATGQTP